MAFGLWLASFERGVQGQFYPVIFRFCLIASAVFSVCVCVSVYYFLHVYVFTLYETYMYNV